MSDSAPERIRRYVEQARGSVLLVHDDACVAVASKVAAASEVAAGAGVAGAGVAGAGVVTWALGSNGPPARKRRGMVVLLVADVAALRRAATVLRGLGGTRNVGCWLAHCSHPPLLAGRPDWPPVIQLQGRAERGGSTMTTVRLARPLEAALVLAELARSAVPSRVRGGEGVVVATTSTRPGGVPPVDAGFRLLSDPADAGDLDLDVPPDLVLDSRPPTVEAHPVTAASGHPVTGRAPVVVTEPPRLVGPLDEGVLNPIGFGAATKGAVWLDEVGSLARRGTTEQLVETLRPHRGVRVGWEGASSADTARVVAGLAMAGVPLLTEQVPPDVVPLLGPELRAALVARADVGQPLGREEHSIRLRRAALREHSTLAWRGRLAALAGLDHRPFPSLSVLLPTKRPHQLEFALRQVARQRHVHPELVLLPHGFTPDPGLVREFVGDRALVVPRAADLPFGELLDTGLEAASGALVAKMDDDDWYGPEFLSDLLWARRYSGADIVGAPPTYVYLRRSDRTVRRNDPSELFTGFVAGGTILTDKPLLQSLGGFRPVHRFVDRQLLSAAQAAGATVYRSHGLGYVLGRAASGHTWVADDAYFLNQKRLLDVQDGFAPSAILEHDRG